VIKENYVINVFGSFDCRFSEQVNHMLRMEKVPYLYACYEDTKFPLEFILSLNKLYCCKFKERQQKIFPTIFIRRS